MSARRRRGRTRPVAFGAAFATVLGLAACGDDGGTGAADRIRDGVERRDADEGDWQELADEVEENPRALVDVDPCELLTQEDATKLFGVHAEKQRNTEPARVGVACFWQGGGEDAERGGDGGKGDDGDNGRSQVSHLLLFRIYAGEAYYGDVFYEEKDREAVSGLGERAFLARDPVTGGLDLQWVQNGLTLMLNYSTFSFEEADRDDEALRHADDVIALARRVSGRAKGVRPEAPPGVASATTGPSTTAGGPATTSTRANGGTGR